MYGAAMNSAIGSYRKTALYTDTAAFDKKNTVRQNSPNADEIAERLRKFDSFEENPAADRDSKLDYFIGKAKEAAAKAQNSYEKNKASTEKKSDKTQNKATYFINGEEVDAKKVKELQDAWNYFRRAASSSGYSVVRSSADDGFSYCIRSGKKSVIMIDPEFMNSIRDNPEALKKYADEIETMKRLDKQFERQAKQQGKTVVSRGWRIEKDGSISSWSVTKTVRKNTKGNLERMNELRNKILKKKMKKKKEDAALQEKRSKRKEERLRLEGRKKAAAKENIKRKIKKVRVYDLTQLTPKKYPGSGKTTSISVSCGRSPSLLSKESKK